MLIDGRTYSANDYIEADICVVGAGPAGLVLAGKLAGEGKRVVVLEAGGQNAEERGQSLRTSLTSVGLPYVTETSRRCGVEGSAPTWCVEAPHGGETLRLREYDFLDFEARPWLGLEEAWPVSVHELHPYYQRARELFGIPPVPEGAWASWSEQLTSSPLASESSGIETKLFDFGSRDYFLEARCRMVTRSPHVTIISNAPVAELLFDRSPSGDYGGVFPDR